MALQAKFRFSIKLLILRSYLIVFVTHLCKRQQFFQLTSTVIETLRLILFGLKNY
jgi:hypothetical protein